jgi:hypothetical protein
MNPKLRHLEAVVAKTRADKKLIRVVGGIEGAPIVRVDCGSFVLVGPMADLSIEDPVEQAQMQDRSKATGCLTGNRRGMLRSRHDAHSMLTGSS